MWCVGELSAVRGQLSAVSSQLSASGGAGIVGRRVDREVLPWLYVCDVVLHPLVLPDHLGFVESAEMNAQKKDERRKIWCLLAQLREVWRDWMPDISGQRAKFLKKLKLMKGKNYEKESWVNC